MIPLAAGLAVGVGVAPMAGLAVGAGLLLADRMRAPAAMSGVGLLGVIAVGGLAVFAGAPAEPALLAGLAGLIAHRRAFQRDEMRVQVLLVAMMLVVAATRTSGPGFAVAVAALLAALPGALRVPGWLVGAVGAVSVPLFLLFPRLSAGVAVEGPVHGLTGFAEDVELGALEPLLDDPAPVLVARFSTPPDAVPYFRGVALDRFDGRRWTSAAERRAEPDWAGLPDSVRVDVQLEAHPEGVLFVAGSVDGLNAGGLRVERDTAGAYHLPGDPRDVTYTVYTQPGRGFGVGRADPFVDAEPVLAVPSLSAEVRALFMDQVQDGMAPAARMDALSAWLREDFAYTREPRDSSSEAPLDAFLLGSRAGHCEYFASALAVGGRVVGVPTRVVNGFLGGEDGGDGTLVVRRYHAHSWVEYFDGEQWITADATPSVGAPVGPGPWVRASEAVEGLWDATVIGYDAQTQLAPARAVAATLMPSAGPRGRDVLGVVLLGGLLGGLILVGWRVERRWVARLEGVPALPVDPVTRELRSAAAAVRDKGFDLPEHLPDVEAARTLSAHAPELAAALEALAWTSYAVRFGGDGPAGLLPRAHAERERVVEVLARYGADGEAS